VTFAPRQASPITHNGLLTLALAAFLSCLPITPAFAQTPPAGGPFDGTWIAEIREARQDLREHREAIQASAGEARRWRELFERDEPGPFSKFLDRIGNGLLLICGTLVLVVTPIGVAMLIREVRRKV
jgi:hypothetical protein